jgi:hypothetical protein
MLIHRPGWERGGAGKAGLCRPGMSSARPGAGAIFLRLAWLLLFAGVGLVWTLSFQRRWPSNASKSAPHTAVVERQGRNRRSGAKPVPRMCWPLRSAFEDQGLAGCGAAHQFARWQPGAGRHHQRRDRAPQAKAQQAAVRRGGRNLRIGRLLHCRRGRRHLRGQGQHCGQHRRADGWFWLHRH